MYLALFICISSCGVKKSLDDQPNIESYTLNSDKKEVLNDSLIFKGKSSLRKNSFGQWELVAFGDNPYDLGNTMGVLTQDLMIKQENLFFDKIKTMVPSEFKQNLLRNFLTWYGRKMYLHISEEYKAEIFGISQYAPINDKIFKNNYLKSLFLHGAHDIGHALQDLALVGCSSFAVWGENTTDGNLLIARNFDFYAGDEFAKDKLISFIHPAEGYRFMEVSWAGMIGVMSGMNEEGLTVTINAGKSDIPLMAKTPISIVTREILQYASNLEEAIAIAKKREVFVSESILVGSANDNKALLIELSPENFGVYQVENSSKIICSNHFQSEAYKEDKNNINAIANSHSKYRFDRMEELLNQTQKVTPQIAVDILRNKEGLKDLKIGFGNEKALNQLLAHHGIVFQPASKTVWVSTNPYQLGEFVAFQLEEVFKRSDEKTISLSNTSLLIDKDPFVYSLDFKNYEEFRNKKRRIVSSIEEEQTISDKDLQQFQELNPDFWEVYYLAGKYYYEKGYLRAALIQFKKALSKEVTTVPDKELIENYIKKINRK